MAAVTAIKDKPDFTSSVWRSFSLRPPYSLPTYLPPCCFQRQGTSSLAEGADVCTKERRCSLHLNCTKNRQLHRVHVAPLRSPGRRSLHSQLRARWEEPRLGPSHHHFLNLRFFICENGIAISKLPTLQSCYEAQMR